MKLRSTLWLFLLLVHDPASGQSSFSLANFRPGAGVDAPIYDALGQPLEGSSYLVELWGAASSDALAPTLRIDTWARWIIGFGNDGYFQGGGVVVVDVAPASYAWLQVRAWDARLGGTYEEVEALGIGGYGESLLFYAEGNDPFREPPEAPAPLIGLQSFSLRPIVPEPCAFALVVMGGIAFLILRGRK